MTTDLATPDSEAPPASPRDRRAAVTVVAAMTVTAVVVAAGGAWGWHWRTHPDAFPRAGGAVGVTVSPERPTTYVGVMFPDREVAGPVTIHSVAPRIEENTAGASVAFYLCLLDPSGSEGQLGAGGQRAFDRSCPRPLPVVSGTEYDGSRDAGQQLVMGITAHRPGVFRSPGVELTYTDGWQRGTELIGIATTVRMRGAR